MYSQSDSSNCSALVRSWKSLLNVSGRNVLLDHLPKNVTSNLLFIVTQKKVLIEKRYFTAHHDMYWVWWQQGPLSLSSVLYNKIGLCGELLQIWITIVMENIENHLFVLFPQLEVVDTYHIIIIIELNIRGNICDFDFAVDIVLNIVFFWWFPLSKYHGIQSIDNFLCKSTSFTNLLWPRMTQPTMEVCLFQMLLLSMYILYCQRIGRTHCLRATSIIVECICMVYYHPLIGSDGVANWI